MSGLLRGADFIRRFLGSNSALFLVGTFTFLWAVLVVPFLSLHQGGIRPFFSSSDGNQDIANYYMAGKIVLNGKYDSLYPVPSGGQEHNIGWPEMSEVKLEYRLLMERYGVEDNHRFILPPPTAFLFIPLALFPYSIARWVWVMSMGLMFWLAGLLSYRIAVREGCSRHWGLFWWFAWIFSPLFLKSLRTGNVTPLVALGLGVAAASVFHHRTAQAVWGCILTTLLKGIGVVFIPIIIVLKRWRIVAWGGGASLFLIAMVLAIAGRDPFDEFFTIVYPTTQGLDSYIGNQSVFGYIARIFGEIRPRYVIVLKSVGLLLMGFCFVKVWQLRELLRENYLFYNAWIVAILCIYLLFSSYCWEHYILFYAPFWSALWVMQGRVGRGLMVVAASLLLIPWAVVRGGSLCSVEPLRSHMMIGQFLLFASALSAVNSMKKAE